MKERQPPPPRQQPAPVESEEDRQRRELGPRGVPGQPDPDRMTPQRAKKTPTHPKPPHTA